MKTLEEALASLIYKKSEWTKEDADAQFKEFAAKNATLLEEIRTNETARMFVFRRSLELNQLLTMLRGLPAPDRSTAAGEAILSTLLQVFANGIIVGVAMEKHDDGGVVVDSETTGG